MLNRLFSKNLILILGCQRSGTTLLHMMLTAHSKITGKDEKEALFSFPTWFELLRRRVGRHGFFCYKCPTKVFALRFVKDHFPHAKIFWIIRNPYAAVSSMPSLIYPDGLNWLQKPLRYNGKSELKRKAKLFPEINGMDAEGMDEVSLGAYIWKYKTMALELCAKGNLNSAVVKFEDLLQDSRRKMKQLLHPMGLMWDETVLNHEKCHSEKKYPGRMAGCKPLDPSRAEPRLNLDQSEISKIKDICNDQMKKFDYA